jgi:hypothetical protein
MPRQSTPVKNSTLPVQKPTVPPPVIQTTQQSFGQTVKEGLAFGVGQAVAHRAVASLAGLFTGPQISGPHPSHPPLCDAERFAFETCMKVKSSDDYCGSEQVAYTQCIRLNKPVRQE